jgi:hypothetical protein
MSNGMSRFLQGDLGIRCRSEADLDLLQAVCADNDVQIDTANWDYSKRGIAVYNSQLNRTEFAPRAYFVTQGMPVVAANLI